MYVYIYIYVCIYIYIHTHFIATQSLFQTYPYNRLNQAEQICIYKTSKSSFFLS